MTQNPVLLVEDFAPDARLIVEMLRDAEGGDEYDLTHVRTMAAAEAALSGQRFSCVLLDLGLPDSTGVENVERLVAARKDVAIVVMTGLDDERAALEALQRGAQEYLVKGRCEGPQLVRVMRHAIERNRLVAELEALRQRDYFHATHDMLTGLPNRQLLDDRVRQAISHSERHQAQFALCYLDLDGFKAVNDTHGHATGDDLLKRISDLIRKSIREGDTAARVGGDEFVMLLSPIGSEREIDAIVGRVVDGVERISQVDGRPVDVGASVGIARYPLNGKTYEELSNLADRHMYSTKRERKAARARAEMAPPEPRAPEHWSVRFLPWVEAEHGEFFGLELQLDGVEANAVVPMEQLLPQAMSAYKAACAGDRALPQRLAINVRGEDLIGPGFTQLVLRVLREAQLNPDVLQLEIPEDECTADADLLVNLSLLRSHGVRIVVDHFGRDDASMARVSRFPVDGLKLDPSLLQGLREHSPSGRAMIESVIRFAQALELEVTVDGVANETDLRTATSLGGQFLQGELMGASLVADQAAALFQACKPAPGFAAGKPSTRPLH